MTLTLGDLFCGGGGFSEGFRQMGFEVRWALDNWAPARETYRKNIGVKPKKDDILKVDSLPSVDVVIGSPPCTFFSLANRGGGGDISIGMELVKKFFELVNEISPKYWIMENVPSLRPSLEEAMDREVIHINGEDIHIPEIQILYADRYGTPQRRRRLFSGRFPLPEKIPEEINLRQVLDSLPDPRKKGFTGKVQDPIHPGHEIEASRLRDHFEDTRFHLTSIDITDSRKKKQEHPVYGRMAFPDDLDRPCRTVTCAASKRTREAIVIRGARSGRDKYRTLTTRERASVQGFPIDYQFWGDSYGTKDRLVGNAVPPPMAKALAEAILSDSGEEIPESPDLCRNTALPIRIHPVRQGRRTIYPNRHFRWYLKTEWQKDRRIELDNLGHVPDNRTKRYQPRLFEHVWVSKVYLGYAKDYRCYELRHKDCLEILKSVIIQGQEWDRLEGQMGQMLMSAEEYLRDKVPDSRSLQQCWVGRVESGMTPYEVLEMIDRFVDDHGPDDGWSGINIPRKYYSGIIKGHFVKGGVHTFRRSPSMDLTVMNLASLLTLSYVCEVINGWT